MQSSCGGTQTLFGETCHEPSTDRVHCRKYSRSGCRAVTLDVPVRSGREWYLDRDRISQSERDWDFCNIDFDSNSNAIATSSITVPPMGHLAKYTNEIFGAVPSGEFQGKMEVVSGLPLAAITLRQRGSVFTSLPVIP
jgi:hypothetical protein